MQRPEVTRLSRLRRQVTKRPALTLFMVGALLLSALAVAPTIKTAITSTGWWRVQKHPECAGFEETLPEASTTVPPPSLIATEVVSDFATPTSIAALPTGELLVAEKAGLLKLFDPNSYAQTIVADLTAIVNSEADNGLIDIALHPEFGSEGESRLYLFYTQNSERPVVISSVQLRPEFTFSAADLDTVQVIPHTGTGHLGGAMNFLPDGDMLVSIGDGGEKWSAQEASSVSGTLLRIDPDAGNTAPAVIARGLRNPSHVTFSPTGADVWITDVGESCVEEINRISMDQISGVTNFGWPLIEGNFDHKRGDRTNIAGTLTMPLTTYGHERGACAVIGGAFIGDWYIFADYCDGVIRGLPADVLPGTKAAELFDLNKLGKPVGIVAIERDALDRVWVLEGWSGAVYRLEVSP